MELVKVFDNDDIIVDYDKDTKKYRVSIFEDHHFKDEFWFDAYEENPYILEIKRKLSPLEVQGIFGSADVGILDCSDIPDEAIDKFNSIGCTSFWIAPDELKEILERQENALD